MNVVMALTERNFRRPSSFGLKLVILRKKDEVKLIPITKLKPYKAFM